MSDRQDIPPCQELPHATQPLQLILDHLMEQTGREPQRRDVILPNAFRQFRQRGRLWREDHESSTVQKRPPDFEG